MQRSAGVPGYWVRVVYGGGGGSVVVVVVVVGCVLGFPRLHTVACCGRQTASAGRLLD